MDNTRIEETETFRAWRSRLRDRMAARKVAIAIVRLKRGLGNIKRLSATVSEVKIDHGPGYRLYFTKRGETLIILLCGGDKASQKRDIEKAQELAGEIHE